MRTQAILILLWALAVCCAPAAAQTGFWACPTSVAGQSLHVYNWTTYIAEDTISNFERLCGVSVTYNTYASDTDMLDELRQGNPGYDVVVPTDSTVYLMIADGVLQPLDLTQIPDFANVNPQFKNPPYDPGNIYTVPYQWGTVGVGYNRTKVGKTITSWDDVFNYTGPVAWLDESHTMLSIALKMLGDDPNTTDAGQVMAAAQYLMAHKSNLYAIAPDTGQDILSAGQVDIAIEYSGDIYQLIGDCECQDFAYAIPDQGSVIWIDNLAIPTGAPNKALAEVFIDYILNAQVGADISNYTAYASPNQEAITEGLIESRYLDDPAIYPNDQMISRLFFNVSNSTIEDLYSRTWDQVKSALGK